MSTADRIRKAREKCGWSQSDLAKRVGITRSSVSQWESGLIKNLRPEHLLSVADETGVSIRWLISGKGTMEDVAATSHAKDLAEAISALSDADVAKILPLVHALAKRDGHTNSS